MFWSHPNPCASTTVRPRGLPVTVTLFLRATSMSGSLSGPAWYPIATIHPVYPFHPFRKPIHRGEKRDRREETPDPSGVRKHLFERSGVPGGTVRSLPF